MTRHNFGAGILIFLSLLAAAPALAQSTAATSEARAAQFVFLIDDSGSMQKTDPNRLAVFAARSLISMLDERDEVSVVRLNGPHDGAQPPPIEPLRKNRRQIEQMLDLGGGIASYSAQKTRCRSALAATRQLLDQAQRPGAAQVVMLLTDGACTPADEEPAVEDFLRGLKSHEEKLFQFYLLRFEGLEYSESLASLAAQTGGQAISANPGDPTSILHTFATALSRSQGYESYLLSPRSQTLAAHRGAERVRLLAIVPDTGPQLSFKIQNPRGGSPQGLGPTRTGTHRYGNGRTFRYAALDYKPDAEPVTVGVDGGGEAWKVVALPEYRLSVRTAVHPGSCESPAGAAASSVDTGSNVCVVTELVNASGNVVGGEVTAGDLTARVRVSRHGAQPVDIVANPLPGGGARFGLPRSNLERGDYEFQPLVTLSLTSGDSVTLRGRPVSLEASSMQVIPQPARFDFGKVQPGSRVTKPFRLGGSFPASPARVEFLDRGNLPACVTAELNGAAEGKAQTLVVNNPYTLALHVYPYCGPRPITYKSETEAAVRLVFEPGKNGREISPVVLPVTFELDYQIQVPPELVVKVKGGKVGDEPLSVGGNFKGEVPLRAVLAGPGESEVWPEDTDDLVLGFAGEHRKKVLRDKEGEPLRAHDFAAGAGAAPLLLRALPSRCCAGGSYRTRLGLAPAESQPLPPGARAPEPIYVPVRVEVEPAGFWACYGFWVLVALAALLLLLLLLYLINMFRNSSFLNLDALATKLKPLVWTEYGDAVEQKTSKNEVTRLVRRALPLHARALAWLKANPFRFGLPGGRYRETVELVLQPNKDVARSQVALLSDDLMSKAEKEPEGYVGRLFAIAIGGTTFLAVPNPDGRIGRMVWQDSFGSAANGEPGKPKAVKLRKAKLLRVLESWEGHEEGMPAGWQVG